MTDGEGNAMINRIVQNDDCASLVATDLIESCRVHINSMFGGSPGNVLAITQDNTIHTLLDLACKRLPVRMRETRVVLRAVREEINAALKNPYHPLYFEFRQQSSAFGLIRRDACPQSHSVT